MIVDNVYLAALDLLGPNCGNESDSMLVGYAQYQ